MLLVVFLVIAMIVVEYIVDMCCLCFNGVVVVIACIIDIVDICVLRV